VDECKPLPHTSDRRMISMAASATAAPSAKPARKRGPSPVHLPPPFLPAAVSFRQGLNLVHLSAQRRRFWWDKGYLGGVEGVFKAGVEGEFMRSGNVLSVRTGSG